MLPYIFYSRKHFRHGQSVPPLKLASQQNYGFLNKVHSDLSVVQKHVKRIRGARDLTAEDYVEMLREDKRKKEEVEKEKERKRQE